MTQTIGLFPTPFMRVERLLGQSLVNALIDEYASAASRPNMQSELLSHSQILAPGSSATLVETGRLIAPKLVEFGALMFGESLAWSIKETWINILKTGGRQSIHNHANSFISGVLYLTRSHASANTVFTKALGGHDFVFNNTNPNAQLGAFNADKWVMPQAGPGDMVLFPSYLLHEVPVNLGEQRVSMAFNAIPDQLDSWGYKVRFSG